MISEYQIQKRFPEAKRSDAGDHIEYYVDCPRPHRKGGRYKMSINANMGTFYCHDCGYAGNAERVFFDGSNDFMNGLSSLVGRENDETSQPKVRRGTRKWENDTPSPGSLVGCHTLGDDHPAVQYMAERGITKEALEEWDIFYCEKGDFNFCDRLGTTTGRIVFPVRMHSKLMGWQARQIETEIDGERAIWKGEKWGWWKPKPIVLKSGKETFEDYIVPKYFTCPGMPRAKAFFNFDQALEDGTDFVILVEGPVDCMKVWSRVIGSFGSRLTPAQIQILQSHWRRVLIILDSEVDEKSEWFDRTIKTIDEVMPVDFMKLDGYHDPGSATTKEIWRQIEQKVGKIWK